MNFINTGWFSWLKQIESRHARNSKYASRTHDPIIVWVDRASDIKMALARSSEQASGSQRRQDIHLPPPQTFDILTALHELLARIDHNSTEAATIPDQTDSLESSSGDVGALYTDLAPLEPKDLPVEVLQIKAKIRNALKELQKLPDMDRSIEEQQMELEELEAKIRKQRSMISKLGDVAKSATGKLG